jgi:hypothetical protein
MSRIIDMSFDAESFAAAERFKIGHPDLWTRLVELCKELLESSPTAAAPPADILALGIMAGQFNQVQMHAEPPAEPHIVMRRAHRQRRIRSGRS